MVVVTARTEPPPPAHTTELLDELGRLPSVDRIRLARLDRLTSHASCGAS